MKLEERITYWRSLIQCTTTDPRLLPGYAEEVRLALRDALYELERYRSDDSLRWRGNWTGIVHADRPTGTGKKVHQSTS